jgi:aminomethyltransferase
MKDIALKNRHIEAGAKMVPFAGYNMPLQYAGLGAEHEAVRESVGVFDVSHMGEFYVRGPKAFELVQKVTSNDVSKLVDGKVQYSCLPNNDGGIVDDLLVYRMNEEEYLLVVNASNIEKDWEWISSHNTMGAEMENASDSISLLAVQGPKAAEAMQSLTAVNLAEMTYYTFEVGAFAGVNDVIISATGYTGSGGFEIYFRNADAETIWDAVLKAGEAFGIQPAGLGARDTLRLEMGFCLYGNDIDDSTSPLEAGLGWITKFTDGNDFVNRTALAAQKEGGVTRKLVALEMIDKGIPRQGYEVIDANGSIIGKVTSGTMSPSMKLGIGLAYVDVPHHALDTEVFIQIRKKQLKAKVVKLPFYKK